MRSKDDIMKELLADIERRNGNIVERKDGVFVVIPKSMRLKEYIRHYEVKHWLCSPLEVIAEITNESGAVSHLIRWNDSFTGKYVTEEFSSDRQRWRRMKDRGIKITTFPYYRRVLSAWIHQKAVQKEDK